MDEENNAHEEQPSQQEQQPVNLNDTEAQLVQEEAFLEAQAQTLAEVKRRRKE
jgi:hypothetical protein